MWGVLGDLGGFGFFGGGGGWGWGFPVGWEEFIDSFGGMGADSFEDVSKVGERVNAFEFAAGDEAIDDGRTPGSGFAAGEHVIFSANDDHSQSAFGNIIVDVEYGTIRVSHESVPLIQGVGDGFAQGIFR